MRPLSMRLTNCGPPVDESDVLAFEQRVDVKLPAQYSRFLIEVNGGDGPPDESGFPATRYFSLNWLGGPVGDADIAAYGADPLGWSDLEFHQDLELSVRGLWNSGLARTWLPVAGVNHEDLLLLRLGDGTIWKMNMVEAFDEDRCSQVATSFGELGLGPVRPAESAGAEPKQQPSRVDRRDVDGQDDHRHF